MLTPYSSPRRDSTLREILLLLRDANPTLRSSPLARYSLRLVFWDADTDRFKSEELAIIPAKDLLVPAPISRSGPPGTANSRLDRTLADAKFVIGDYLDVAYIGSALPIVPGALPGTNNLSNPSAPHPPVGGFGVPPSGPHGPGGYGAPPHLRGGAPVGPGGGGRGGFAGVPRGAPGGPRDVIGGRRDNTTWAQPSGPSSRGRGGFGAGGGGGGGRGGFGGPVHGGGGGRPTPADQGWGRRRPSHSEQNGDRVRSISPFLRSRLCSSSSWPTSQIPPPRRRDSRSRSPDRNGSGRRRSSSRSRSPPPPPRKNRPYDDEEMRD